MEKVGVEIPELKNCCMKKNFKSNALFFSIYSVSLYKQIEN